MNTFKSKQIYVNERYSIYYSTTFRTDDLIRYSYPDRPEALSSRVIYIYIIYIYIIIIFDIYIYIFFHRGPKRFYNPKQRRLPGEAGRTVECNMQSHRKPNAICAVEKRKNTRGCHSKTPCPWSCDADHITRYWSRLGKLHLCGRKFPGCYDCACQARWASYFKTPSIGPARESNPRTPALQSRALPTDLTLPVVSFTAVFSTLRTSGALRDGTENGCN